MHTWSAQNQLLKKRWHDSIGCPWNLGTNCWDRLGSVLFQWFPPRSRLTSPPTLIKLDFQLTNHSPEYSAAWFMSKWRGHDGVLCQKFIPPFWCSVNFMFASALSLYLGTYFRCQQTTLFQTWQLCLHHVESNHSNLFMKVAALAQQRADEPPHEARINRFIAPTGETVKPLRINIS